MKKINILIFSILCFSIPCNGMLDGIQPYLDEEKKSMGNLIHSKLFTGKKNQNRRKMMYSVNQVKCVVVTKIILHWKKSLKFPIGNAEPREN